MSETLLGAAIGGGFALLGVFLTLWFQSVQNEQLARRKHRDDRITEELTYLKELRHTIIKDVRALIRLAQFKTATEEDRQASGALYTTLAEISLLVDPIIDSVTRDTLNRYLDTSSTLGRRLLGPPPNYDHYPELWDSQPLNSLQARLDATDDLLIQAEACMARLQNLIDSKYEEYGVPPPYFTRPGANLISKVLRKLHQR
jgi:hypothetical protein